VGQVCVSGYQYHLRSKESWLLRPQPYLGDRSWQSLLQSLGETDGVLTECLRGLPELRDQVQLYHSTRNRPQVRTVRFEQLSTNFSGAMRFVFRFVAPVLMPPQRAAEERASTRSHEEHYYAAPIERVVKSVGKFDLSLNPPKPDKAAHISSTADKARLRRILLGHSRIGRALVALRSLLDYAPSPPATAADLTGTGGAAVDADCVFAEVDRIRADFWGAPAQQPSKIGTGGWHFNLLS